MQIWRICRARFAGEAFSGEGARRFGGRWNSPDDLVAIAATLPAGEPARRFETEELPPDWWTDDFVPLRALGDKWIREKSSLALSVPSAALRTEWNVLVNPLHPAIAEIKVEEPQAFRFDARMFR
jgi:RES domain-containing protein